MQTLSNTIRFFNLPQNTFRLLRMAKESDKKQQRVLHLLQHMF